MTDRFVLDTPPGMPNEAAYQQCLNQKIRENAAIGVVDAHDKATGLVHECRPELKAWESALVAANPTTPGATRKASAFIATYESTATDRVAAALPKSTAY